MNKLSTSSQTMKDFIMKQVKERDDKVKTEIDTRNEKEIRQDTVNSRIDDNILRVYVAPLIEGMKLDDVLEFLNDFYMNNGTLEEHESIETSKSTRR